MIVAYMKLVRDDYIAVGRDVISDSKAHPLKATVIYATIGFSFYAFLTNPTEHDFKNKLLLEANDVLLLSENIRNPSSAAHVKALLSYYNEGLIRRLNLGVASLIWIDNYDASCDLFEARCKSLKPHWLNFHHRVVDIGFCGQWWLIDRAMIDFDINPNEFSS